jgi:hypothetical protein
VQRQCVPSRKTWRDGVSVDGHTIRTRKKTRGAMRVWSHDSTAILLVG